MASKFLKYKAEERAKVNDKEYGEGTYGSTADLEQKLEKTKKTSGESSSTKSGGAETKNLKSRASSFLQKKAVDRSLMEARQPYNFQPISFSSPVSNTTKDNYTPLVKHDAEYWQKRYEEEMERLKIEHANDPAFPVAAHAVAIVDEEKKREDYIVKYQDKTYEDNFWGQFAASYRAGDIAERSNKAVSEYLASGDKADYEYSNELDKLAERIRNNNKDVYADDATLSWLSQDTAGYLPQFFNRSVPQAIGGTFGGIVGGGIGLFATAEGGGFGAIPGAKIGAKAGATIASGVDSYDSMKASAFKGLVELGADEETAKAAANDEAILGAITEMGDTWFTFTKFGYGAVLDLIGKGAAKETAKSGLTKLATILGKYGLNIEQERAEEGIQGAISIANKRRVYNEITRNADKEIGQYGKGNIDLYNRPQYKYSDGLVATVESASFEIDGEIVLLPTIAYDSQGKAIKLTDDEAVKRYFETGEHLGKFKTEEEANEYAQKLHYAQEYYYSDNKDEYNEQGLWGLTKDAGKVLVGADFGTEDPETIAEINEQKRAGGVIAAVMGLPGTAFDTAATGYVEYRNSQSNKQIDSIIKSGLETDPESEAYKIAEKLKAKKDAGEAISSKEATESVIATWAEKSPDTLEKVAMDVVTSRNAPESAKTEPISNVYATNDSLPTREEKSFKSYRMNSILGNGERTVGVVDGQAFVTNGKDILPSPTNRSVFLPVSDTESAKVEFGANESNKTSENISKLLNPEQYTPISKGNYVDGTLEGVGDVRVFTDENGREIAIEANVAEFFEGYNLEATFRGGKPYAIKATDSDGKVAGVAMAVWMDTSGQKYNITQAETSIKSPSSVSRDTGRGMSVVKQVEAKSINNEPITAEEAQQASGYGSVGSRVLAEFVNNTKDKSFSQVKGDMHDAYMAGWANRDINITDTRQKEMYNAGKMDKIMQDVEAKAKAENATTYDDGLVENENFKKLSKTSQELLRMLAKDHKMSVEMKDFIIASIMRVNGKQKVAFANASHADGRMEGSMSAKEKPLFVWAIHEDGHRMEQMATDEWNALSDFVYARAEKRANGATFNKMKSQHDNAGLSLSTRGYVGEVVMRELETVFRSEKELVKFIKDLDASPKAKSGFQKFMQYLSDIIKELMWMIENKKLSAEGLRAAKAELAEIEHIKELYGKAYLATRDAVNKVSTSQTSESASNSKIESKSNTSPTQNKTSLKSPLKAQKSTGINTGDVFKAKNTGTEYKILARDDKNTTVEISSEEGKKTMVISNEIADRNFVNMSDDGITKWIDEDLHIDNRTWEDVSDRKVKAFQFLFPEMQKFYAPLAQELLGDLDNTVKGERIAITRDNGQYSAEMSFTGVKRLTSDAIARIKDTTNATYDDIRNALNRLINDEGQENIALAKKIELVLDEMLTDGYSTFEGQKIPPNEEYIAKKEGLLGKTYDAEASDNYDGWEDLMGSWSNDGVSFSLKNENITINSRIPYVKLLNYISVAKKDYSTLNKLEAKVGKIKKGTYQNDATGYQASITKETIDKAIRPTHKNFNRFKESHIRNLNAILKLPELFKNAVYVDSKNPQKTKNQNKAIKEYHHFVAPIYMDNGEYRALITAREKINSNTLYVLRVEILPTQKRHTPVATQQNNNAGGSQLLSVPSDISIPELVNGVKIYNYDTQTEDTYTSADIQFSLVDSEGNTLTEAQQEYFKDSKVRDENGNLLVVYHGSPSKFTVFNHKYMNVNGNSHGRGFYFTEKRSLAEGYERKSGQLLKGYLNIAKPLSEDKVTINKADFLKLIKATCKEEAQEYVNDGEYDSVSEALRDTWLSNYVNTYETSMANAYAEVANTIYSANTNDVEMIAELTNAGRNDIVLRLTHDVLGYDGVIYTADDGTHEFVSLVSEQFKSVDNANPTSNPDINFSLIDPVEETKNLIAVHNATEEKLLNALKLGGMPSPSIAITKKDMSHEKFGDISLVFRKQTISPTDRRNKIYSGDAYTPTGVRVEYDVDGDILQEFNKRLQELTPEWTNERLPSVDAGTAEVENDSLFNAYERNDRAKLAFLREKGKAPKVAMRTPTLSNFVSNDTVIALAKAFSAKQLSDIANTSEGLRQYKNAFLKVIRDTEDSKVVEMGIYTADAVHYFDIEETARAAARVKENKYKIKKEVDYRKNYELIDKKFTKALKAEYRAWVDENTKDAIIDKGIRNNRDLFAPSGKRRSFKQLHEPYNLSNIIKQMFSGEEKGVALFGGNPIGAAQSEYSSIAEVKANASRLQQLEQEEYDKIKDAIEDDVLELAQKMQIRSDVFAVKGLLAEAIGKKTKQQADSYLKRESQGWANYSPEFTNELWDIRERILNMPTEYFEAKPQRAVNFNEVALAVLPKGKTTLRRLLEDAGVQKVVYYDKSVDGDRLKKINSVPDVNFSLKEGKLSKAEKEFLNTVEDMENGKKGSSERLAKYVKDGTISTKIYQDLIEQYGAIPKGENPYRDVSVPQKTAKNKKVSQTVRTILEAEATPDEAVPTIEKMVEDGIFSYDAYSDKQAIENGEDYIKEHGWNQSLVDWFDAVNKGEVSKDITTTGWVLYNHAANSGDAETAIMILDAMVRHQRSAAQALQATRILKKLSPEAQLYGVQRSVEAFQKELTDKYGDKAPDLKIDESLAEQFMNAKTEDERTAAKIELYKDIGRQMPSNWLDKWNAWRYIAMLTNPRTHVRNILGNALFAPVVATKNLTATAIEAMVKPLVSLSGKEMARGKAFVWGSKADRALLKAAWNDYSNVQDIISGDGKYNDSAIGDKAVQEGRRIFKGIFAPIEWVRRGNSKLLEWEDMWFSKPHYAYALAQYCKANNITAEQIDRGKALAPARDYAIKEAQKATYRDTNAFSQMISDIGKSGKRTWATNLKRTLVEGVLPFRKTPANILVRGVEYSPIGIIKGIANLRKVGKEVDGKVFTASEAIDSISAGLTGTGLLALGIYLAAQGLIRGHGEDEKEEKEFSELMGHQAYSLELPNGQSITLDWLAPESLPFFTGVAVWEATKGNKEDVSPASIIASVMGMSDPMLEMSFLQGINDVLESIGYAKSNDMKPVSTVLSSAVTSYITQAIPTLFGQIERTGEEERMTTYTEEDGYLTKDMQYTLGKMSAKIPFWDYHQIPYIDAWGRREASGTALKRGLNNFLNPAYTSTIEESAMEKELLRLYESTGETKVFPSRADKYFTVDKARKDLTADEYVRYATLKGEKSYKLVSDLVNSKAYKKLDDGEKIKAISEAYDYANQKAKQAVSNYKGDSWVATADEFGKGVGNYLAFRADYNDTKSDNGGKIEKTEVIDIIMDMAQNDNEMWLMYLDKYDSENAQNVRDKGIEGETYLNFLDALDEVDEPTKSGKYGSYTQDEAKKAVNRVDGLTRKEKSILWQSVNSSWKNNPF